MDNYLLRGLVIGLIFGLPVGAVGAITVQITLNHGIKAGLASGLGSSIADCLYACIGAFGLTLISDFLLKFQTIINILGSTLILIMGINMILEKKERAAILVPAYGGIKIFLYSFAVGITNPTAILTFLFAFSYFGISGQLDIFQGILLVCGVFIGTYIWWLILSVVTNELKKKTKCKNRKKSNRVFGMILTLFGAVIFVRTIL